AVIATGHRCPLLSATVRPPFSATSPPFCSLNCYLSSSVHCLKLKMATASFFSQGSIISFSGTPIITIEKLNWKNYRAWSDLVEVWFLGQGFHDHLEKQEAEILEENRVSWLKLDYQLCAILWQFVSLELLEILRSFKTCYSFWTNARDVFANDVQRLFDSTQKIVSLQQTNHDMVSHIASQSQGCC
ncbi:hypothetical protein CR513_20468, partial [Mucuna pruriens]